MNQNAIKVIGIKDKARKNVDLSNVNQVEGLKDILTRDFVEWSNFDSWESISVQQWIFSKALDVYEERKFLLNVIVVNMWVLLKMILRKSKKKNVMVKKVLT